MIHEALYTNVIGLLRNLQTCFPEKVSIAESIQKYSVSENSTREEKTQRYQRLLDDLTKDDLPVDSIKKIYACDASVFENPELQQHSFFSVLHIQDVLQDVTPEEWAGSIFPCLQNILRYSTISKHVGPTLTDFESIAQTFIQKNPSLQPHERQQALMQSLFTDDEMRQKLLATFANPAKIQSLLQSAGPILAGLNLFQKEEKNPIDDIPSDTTITTTTTTTGTQGSLSNLHKSRKKKMCESKKKTPDLFEEIQNLTKGGDTITSEELDCVSSSISSILSDKNANDAIKSLLKGGPPDLSSLLQCMTGLTHSAQS
jgi:hypothetical protein